MNENETFHHTNSPIFILVILQERISEWRSPTFPKNISHAPCIIKMNRFSKYAVRTEDTQMKFWRNISLKLILLGEKGHSKTKKTSHRKKYCLLQHNIIWLDLTSRTKWWRNGTLFKTNFAQQKFYSSFQGCIVTAFSLHNMHNVESVPGMKSSVNPPYPHCFLVLNMEGINFGDLWTFIKG